MESVHAFDFVNRELYTVRGVRLPIKWLNINKLLKYTDYAMQILWKYAPVKLLLDIHYVCLYLLYTCNVIYVPGSISADSAHRVR